MRIFTVDRESESSLKSKTKAVRTRFSGARVVAAASAMALFVIAMSAVLVPTMQAQATTDVAGASTQGLCQPSVIGNRRIPKESILARLFSHQGDLYDKAVVARDFNSLWNTGYFDDIQIELVSTPKCLQLIVYVCGTRVECSTRPTASLRSPRTARSAVPTIRAIRVESVWGIGGARTI